MRYELKLKTLTITCALSLSILFPSLVQAQSDAWWLNATFEPIGNTINGVSISQIDSNWSNAMVLTIEMMPEGSKEDFNHDEIDYNFSIEHDFNVNNCFDCGHHSTLEWKGDYYGWVEYEFDPYE